MALINGDEDPNNLVGLPGNDTITGGGGNDTLTAQGGVDALYGQNDDDLLYGGNGDSFLNGGNGNDQLVLGTLGGPGTIGRAYGGSDDDVIVVYGPLAGSVADGGTGNNILFLTTGLDSGPAESFFIDISTGGGNALRNGSNTLLFDDIDQLFYVGDEANDTVIGGAMIDVVFGGRGLNRIETGGGDDAVMVDYGGRQTLDGGAGDDILLTQNPTFSVYFIVDPDGSVDDGQLSTIQNFERYWINGSTLADVIRTGDGNDQITGLDGNDTLSGWGGADTVAGDKGRDILNGDDGADRLRGGGGQDTLYGGEGADLLSGGSGADIMFGGAGNDTLTGGKGIDLFWGDADADTFRFNTAFEGAAAEDVIGDFLSGVDRILIAQDILDGTPATGRMTADDLAFGAASIGTDAQFLYFFSGSIGFLFWDPDGTGATDATLITKFLNTPTLVGTDIYIA